MSWVAVGVAVFGAVSASQSASSARSAANRRAKNQLGFEQDKYDDWKDTYGGIEENLSNYYNNLDPDTYATAGLEAFQQERDTQLERVRATLAQRGISDSGIAAATEVNYAMDTAQTRAQIRRDAPAKVAEAQSRFLGVGLGQNPSAGLSNALATEAQRSHNVAQQSSAVSGQAVAGAVGAVGTALDDYQNRPRQPTYDEDIPTSTPIYNGGPAL